MSALRAGTGAAGGRTPARRSLRERLLAGIAALGVAASGAFLFPQAVQAAEITVTDARFAWSINDESGNSAFYGGCNFLSAGIAGDNGGATVWTAEEAERLYATEDGNVSIRKPDADGGWVTPTWDTKCQAPDGGSITPPSNDRFSGNEVVIENGTGTVDPASGDAEIRWDGSFTVVFYGGMTYWSVTDPVLRIEDGRGTLTGTASGYGADMFDLSKWVPLEPREIELATFADAEVGEDGLEIQPDYLGVEIDVEADGPSGPQIRSGDHWGSFPQSFIDFQIETGQAAYWYSSGGQVDRHKPANPFTVTYSADATPRVTFDDAGSWPPLRLPASRDTLTAGLQNIGLPVLDEEGRETGELEPVPENSVVTVIAAGGPEGGVQLESAGATNAVNASGRATVSVRLDALEPGQYWLMFLVNDRIIPLGNTGRDDHRVALEYGVAEPEGPPTSLEATALSPSSVLLGWEPPGGTVGSYRIDAYEGDEPSGDPVRLREASASAPGGASEKTVQGLQAATEYTFTVTPVFAGQDYETSEPVTVRTLESGSAPGGEEPPGEGPGEDPASGGEPSDGAVFYWGINNETNSGAYWGGCNFLSAGRSGDAGAAAVWSQPDGLYSGSEGNVSVEKPDANGNFVPATWGNKCQDRNGRTVQVSQPFDSEPWTETRVKITGGEVSEHEDGSVTVEWDGSFTVVFYGGMTYWWASDPVLELDPSGNGRVTATAGGYGADMFDASKWVELDERTITLADLRGVDVDAALDQGYFEQTPEYLGVRYAGNHEGAGGDAVGGVDELPSSQARRDAENEAYWGSFPESFVDFQAETGQYSYWFTSNGARDPYKPALPLTVSFDGEYAPAAGNYSGQDTGAGGGTSPSNPGGPAGPGSGAPEAAGSPADASTREQADVNAASAQTPGSAGIGALNPWVWGIAGASVLAIGGANWAVWSFIRRKIGLDPKALL
ncbi:fibronectin type III domain-containing protein [Sediminivirga luteola]|uniref:fibronectin type III domain-containing protein n=1 Tax=Sediminivirga luteola TaxID=1774748 RepID=UPI001F577C07|nr:fibronectin type III domain-containing protein [Sediminivirga luteola]